MPKNYKSYPVPVLPPEDVRFEQLAQPEKDRVFKAILDWYKAWIAGLSFWISVDWAMPLPRYLVMAVFEDEEGKRQPCLAVLDPEQDPAWHVVIVSKEGKVEGNVTHWMPIPAMPKREEETQ